MLKKTKNTNYFLIHPIKDYITLTTTKEGNQTTNTYTWFDRTLFTHSWGNGEATFMIDMDVLTAVYKAAGMHYKVQFYFVDNMDRLYAYLGYKRAIRIETLIDIDIEEGETVERYGIEFNTVKSLSIVQYFGGDGIGNTSGTFYLQLPKNVYFHQIPNGLEWIPEEGLNPSVSVDNLWYENDEGEEVFHEPTEEDYKNEIEHWLECLYQAPVIKLDHKISIVGKYQSLWELSHHF